MGKLLGSYTVRLDAPHAGQRIVEAGLKRFSVLSQGRRWGKTAWGIKRVILPALSGGRTAWYAPSFPFVTEVWGELIERLGPLVAKRNKSEKRIDLIGGGRIEVWSLENPDSGRGRKYHHVSIDEAAHARLLEEAWTKTIRATLADYRGTADFYSTPKGRNFFWELFQRGNPDSELYDTGGEWASWNLPTSTNPYILPSEIAAARRELPPTVFSQEFLAEFLEVGGRYFTEWREADHICLPFPVPAHYHFFGGMDMGTARPFCFLLMAADAGGKVYVIDEVYTTGKGPKELAPLVVECLRRHGQMLGEVPIACDPAMFPPKDPAQRVGEADIEAFWGAGLNCFPANNQRLHGWRNVRGYLHVRRPIRHGDDIIGHDPLIQVFKGRCANLIRTIPLMVHDERHGHEEDLDTTLEDHAADALRYGLNQRPSKGDPDAEEANLPRFLRRKTPKKMRL